MLTCFNFRHMGTAGLETWVSDVSRLETSSNEVNLQGQVFAN